MTEATKEMVARLRFVEEYLAHHGHAREEILHAAAADLIEQQAARIAELEARVNAHHVAWAIVNTDGFAKFVTNDEEEAARWRDTYRDVWPLVYAASPSAPTLNAETVPGDLMKDAERYRKCREHGVKRRDFDKPEDYDAMVDYAIERMEVKFRTGHNYGKKMQPDGTLKAPDAALAASEPNNTGN